MSTPTTFESFFLREKANAGIDVPLFLPDGTPTEHKLHILGKDSDIFRQTEAECRRLLLEAAASKDQKKVAAVSVANTEKLIACLITGWTFDIPCTSENKLKLLREAPQIQDAVDKVATMRELFFKNGSVNSTPSQEQNSN